MVHTVRVFAFKDISSWINETYKGDEITTRKGLKKGEVDVWIACPIHIDTKETIRLNRVLGLHKINKNGK